MTFWIITFVLALMVAGILVLALIRGRAQAGSDGSAGAYDLKVYRDQLREVDRDLARGVIGAGDADRVRVEVSRRILAADARVQAARTGQDQPAMPARVMALGLAVLVVAGSVALYRGLGAPGYGDLGLERRILMAEVARETRPGQDLAESQRPAVAKPQLDENYQGLIDQLRAKVAENPDDVQGQVLLAQHEARSGDFSAAHRAQTRVIALMGDTVSARQFAELGELMVVAAGGYVSPEAENALRAALELDPRHGPARYYWGLMLAQTGRPDLAFRVWESTLRQGPVDAPWLLPIRELIGEMAWRAGVEYTLPPAPIAPPLAGPTQEDMAAASEMSQEDRQQMIRSMVDRLSERLAEDGGSPAEWARLIGALAVLGDTVRAQSIFDEAKTVFAGDDAALGTVTGAARDAGLSL